jgi:meso-butanediol dehydrogenase / (S,S)-butanediol dehydrogenase / diacetyl reductase
MSTQRFVDKVAIVTGGSAGIGAATVERLARDGARVLVADINAPASSNPAVRFESCDVSRPEDILRMVASAVQEYRRVDLLVNNAGVGLLAKTPDVEPELWRKIFAVNIDAVFLACRALIPHMAANGGGAIVNVASISGLLGDYGFTAYNASKAAVINYTRALALDHARDGIRVNALCPGFIARTGLTMALEDHSGDRAEWDARIPMHRAGTTAEMANVITFLLSPEASYMTGSIVVADGGVMAHTGQPDVAEQWRLRGT